MNPRPHDMTDSVPRMVEFCNGTGIPVRFEPVLATPDCLPGVLIVGAELRVDRFRLKYPGDILHESACVALFHPSVRSGLKGHINYLDSQTKAAHAMAVGAWTYAACVHLNIASEVVFHEGGYQGQSQWLIESYRGGQCFGLPLLQWLGMAADCQTAPQLGVKPYPHMLHWLRQHDEQTSLLFNNPRSAS